MAIHEEKKAGGSMAAAGINNMWRPASMA